MKKEYKGKRNADIDGDEPNKRRCGNASTVHSNKVPTGLAGSPSRVYHDIQPQIQNPVGDGDGSPSNGHPGLDVGRAFRGKCHSNMLLVLKALTKTKFSENQSS
jgi:hypothetical protein